MNKDKIEDIFSSGMRAIAKVIINTPTEQKAFIKSLKWHLVQEALEINPKASNSEISSMTGIHRSKVKQIKQESKPKETKGKEAVILSDLWRYKDDKNMVPLRGENSFYSISEKTLTSSYSAKSSLDMLIKSGNIINHGEYVEILSKSFNASYDMSLALKIAGSAFNRLINTTLSNVEGKEEPKYQNTVWSTKIPFDVIKASTSVKVKNYINNVTIIDIRNMIDEDERNVPEYSYEEYGISLLEFYKSPNK